MRIVAFVISITWFCGCRSPQETFRAKVCHASTCQTSPTVPVMTSQALQHPQTYSIDDLVNLGLQQSPQIKEARHRIQSARQRIPQDLSLPDPIVNTTTHLSPVETAAGRQAFALGISQKFVDLDRRAIKAAISHDEVKTLESELTRIQHQLAEDIRVACLQLLTTRETIQITQEDLQSLAQIEEVVLRQYEVNKEVSQQDVLNVQIEQSKVENQLTRLQTKRRSYEGRLARLVRLPISTEFSIIDQLGEVAHDGDVEALIAQALHTRPELNSQLSNIRRERRKICLANLQSKSDFTVGLNWIATSSDGISPVSNGNDALLLGIGFNLPIRTDRISAAKRQAQQTSYASMSKLESLQDQITEEVFDSVNKLDSTEMTLSLIEDDIIPKSLRTLDLSIEEYAEGKTDYTQLIANWRSVLKYRIAAVNLRSERMQLMATLTRQLGQVQPTHRAVVSPQVQPLPTTDRDADEAVSDSVDPETDSEVDQIRDAIDGEESNDSAEN